jgi:hypothetical protein
MRLVLVGALVTACGCGGSQTASVDAPLAPASSKTYPIHFSHPGRVGDRSHVVIELTENTGTTILQGDVVAQETHQKKVTHFDAIGTVAKVDEKGATTRAQYDVKDLSVDGHPLAHGSVDITNAPKEEDATILVEGAPASKEVHKAFESLLKLSLGGATDDDMFGTRTPQAVGAHWPINATLARQDLKESAGLEAQSITGESWLEATTRVGDLDCLDVRSKLGLELSSIPDLPPGATIDSGHADAEIRAAMPLDGHSDSPAAHMSLTMTVKLRVKGPNGPLGLVVKFERVQDGRFAQL